ncbi:MAG TPA: hypothetical protein VJB69_01745 [Candidatus Paceibacterota bacterium]
MAIYEPPPEPKVCLKCGGSIYYKDGSPPPPSDEYHQRCPCCIIIGPGHRPFWVLDEENHVCQNPPNKKVIAKERQRIRRDPLMQHLKKQLDKAIKKKGVEK